MWVYMNFENVDQLLEKYSLLLKIRYNNHNTDNVFLEDEIFDTKQRLLVQQVPTETLEALEERYKVE